MSVDLNSLKTTFGTIANVYDAVRPGYPYEVAAQVLAHFPAPQAISSLEVGCGSGQATGLFAPSGMQILGIDFSPNLIALAREHFAGSRNVRFAVCAFEAFEPHSTFDLVYSAQAFHWIPSTVGLPRAASLLKPGGFLALFWNFFRYDADATLLQIRDCIIQHIPLFARYPEGSPSEYESFREQWMSEIAQTHLLENVTVQAIETTCTYFLEDYLVMVSSYSWFQSQPEHVRDELVSELRNSFNDPLPPFPVQTMLIMAERTLSDQPSH